MSHDSPVRYAVYAPESPGEHVFENLLDAKKMCASPGTRFKKCATQEEVDEFYRRSAQLPTEECPVAPEPPFAFKEPAGAQLNAFRRYIESMQNAKFDDLVEENPRYLVNTSGERPTIYHNSLRLNALHIAATAGNLYVTQRILKLITDPAFIAKAYGTDQNALFKSGHLLDLYLNLPNNRALQTPLHFASKMGFVDVVKDSGETAAELACRGMRGVTELERRRKAQEIRKVLDQVPYYVALYRLTDNTGRPQHVITTENPIEFGLELSETEFRQSLRRTPQVESPAKTVQYLDRPVLVDLVPSFDGDFLFSPNLSLSANSSFLSCPSSDSALRRRKSFRAYRLTCYVGPFTDESKAREFYTSWKTHNRDFILANPMDGYESIGAMLAVKDDVLFNDEFVDDSDQAPSERWMDSAGDAMLNESVDAMLNESVASVENDEDVFVDALDHFVDDFLPNDSMNVPERVDLAEIMRTMFISMGDDKENRNVDENDVFFDAEDRETEALAKMNGPANPSMKHDSVDDLVELFGAKLSLKTPDKL